MVNSKKLLNFGMLGFVCLFVYLFNSINDGA